MDAATTLLIVLLSLGAVQGVVYGIGLLRKPHVNVASNQFLATLLFLLSYQLSCQILRLFGLGHYDVLYHWMIELNWAYGPLVYFFVKAQITPHFSFKQREWWHFSPLGIQVVCSNFVRAQNFYWDGTRESLSWLGYWGYVVWMNYPTVYLIASLLIIIYG
ncbi:MAG: AraC family transcriptional regulator, partial [Bacteroidota bacterium]